MSSNKSNHIENIFGQPVAVDPELLLDYLSGKLTPKKQHLVEKLLLDDPFLAEAIEGLEAIPVAKREEIIFSLLGREKKEAVVIPLKTWGIAAAVLVGITSLFFLTKTIVSTSNETLAYKEVENDQVVEEQVKEVTGESKPDEMREAPLEEPVLELVEEENEAEPEPEKIETRKKELLTADIALGDVSSDSVQPSYNIAYNDQDLESGLEGVSETKEEMIASSPMKSKKQAVNTKQLSSEMISVYKTKFMASNYKATATGSVSRSAESISKKQEKALQSYREGLAALESKKYSTAVDELENAYKKDESLPEVNFYLSSAYLVSGEDVSKVKKVFKPQKTLNFTQEKQWMQTIILLNEGKEDAAKTQLQKIVDSGSGYAEDAQKVLKKLE